MLDIWCFELLNFKWLENNCKEPNIVLNIVLKYLSRSQYLLYLFAYIYIPKKGFVSCPKCAHQYLVSSEKYFLPNAIQYFVWHKRRILPLGHSSLSWFKGMKKHIKLVYVNTEWWSCIMCFFTIHSIKCFLLFIIQTINVNDKSGRIWYQEKNHLKEWNRNASKVFSNKIFLHEHKK